eukprot:TRINITY_DN11541_c0_g1_i1.p1 TRINITY_DN11541_c0_g1~~TRINITY_DN11541_c0_g1_i1.p1  ORF type:complete len:543 (+),score=121.00 TRINITY_DN11541_c0_g1_i1:168-1796(+)
MKYPSVYLCLLLPHQYLTQPLKIIKCCPEGSTLNLSYVCIKSSASLINTLAKSKPNQYTDIELDGPRKPECEAGLEHQKLSKQNLLTAGGGALSYKYKEPFNKDDVCFDILEEENGEQDVVFLHCDPCSNRTCVNLCCPHGHAFKDDLEDDVEKEHRCDPEPGIQKRCQVHDDEELLWGEEVWAEGAAVTKEKRKDIVFVSSKESFKCAGKKSLVPAEFLFGPQDMRLQADGPLHVLLEDVEQNKTDKMEFPASEFCLAFTDIPEYEDYYDEYEQNTSSPETSTTIPERIIRPLYSVCYEVEAEKGEYFTGIFYPAAIFISCIFILFTIIIYVVLHDLRSNLFGKITLGFLCNVFVCYLFLGIHYSLDLKGNKDYLDTPFCKFLGYITQHSFIAFFFWTNAMAINITKKFSNILVSSNDGSQKKALILNMLYAQGVPLLITLVTALIDTYGSCDSILPNMGRYTCFLGAEFNPNIMFIFTPEFVYFYLIISVIMISNLICFLITGYFLTSHWSTVRNMQTSNGDNLWVHIMVVLKLFLIMGM